MRECDGAVGVVSDNVIRFPDGDYYCPNCGGRWFRLVDPFTSVLADAPRAAVALSTDGRIAGYYGSFRCLGCET